MPADSTETRLSGARTRLILDRPFLYAGCFSSREMGVMLFD